MSTEPISLTVAENGRIRIDPAVIAEAHRQVGVCNACRYCEGFCSVFPAVHRQRSFSDGDIIQLANLCHNCRGCYYSCQYTAPHEFAINLPQILANTRVASWHRFVRPARFADLFQRRGVAVAVFLVVTIALMFHTITQLNFSGGKGFYAYLSHTAMVTLFTPLFLIPLIVIGHALRSYWRAVEGQKISLADISQALTQTADMRNLGGGQGQGCNYEQQDRYSNARRWYHQATMYGFLLCFASTASGTIVHYVFDLSAPYTLLSLPKILGIPGGILLSVGCAGLAWLKTKADPNLGASQVWSGEMAFVLLLGATGFTGLVLYAASGTSLVPALLALHLSTVLVFFVLMPYSKMVHGFFRMAALIRDSQPRRSYTNQP